MLAVIQASKCDTGPNDKEDDCLKFPVHTLCGFGDMNDQYHDLQQSYGRCLRDKAFIERFYEIFIARDLEIAAMFAKTDFQSQRLALRRGISVAISHAAGSNMATRTVQQMGDAHGRNGRVPVRPELYVHWLESLLAVIEEKDPEATPQLLARWRQGMQVVIDTFIARYPAGKVA